MDKEALTIGAKIWVSQEGELLWQEIKMQQETMSPKTAVHILVLYFLISFFKRIAYKHSYFYYMLMLLRPY